MAHGDDGDGGPLRSRRVIVALCLAIGLGAGAGRAIGDPDPATGGHKIRYAAKTEVGAGRTGNADYFALIEDEQSFVVANGAGAAAPAASKHAAEAFQSFFTRTGDPDAEWPVAMDRSLSYIENRVVASLKGANAQLHVGRNERATAVAAVVSGDRVTIGHVGNDRAYLIRGDRIQRLTQDHTMLEEYRRDHPEATPDDLDRVPRKAVPTRALGRRPSVEVDVATFDVIDGDRIVLCSEGPAALDDGEILDIVRARGVEVRDLEVTTAALVLRAGQVSHADVTVMMLAFVNKTP